MSEEMRKEFERFMFDFLGVDVGGNRGITPSGHDGYVFGDDDSTMVCTVAWLSWNASREAMKFAELKSKYSQQYDNESKYLSSDADIYKNALLQHYKDAE